MTCFRILSNTRVTRIKSAIIAHPDVWLPRCSLRHGVGGEKDGLLSGDASMAALQKKFRFLVPNS